MKYYLVIKFAIFKVMGEFRGKEISQTRTIIHSYVPYRKTTKVGEKTPKN